MVNWFSFILGLGATLGLAWVAWKAPRLLVTNRLDAGLLFLLGGFIFARLGFVVTNWNYYQAHWIEIPQLWLGGLSGFGAITGGLMGLLILALSRKEKPGKLADDLFPLFMILTAASWLACWTNGFAYGISSSNNWWGVSAVDEWGTWEKRWPVQFLGAFIILVAFFLINQFQNRLHQPGEIASLGFMTIVVSLLGLSFLRADPIQTWHNWRYDSWAALIFSLIAAGLCLVAFWPRQKKPDILIQENDG